MRRRLANEYDKLLGIEVGTIRVILIDLYINRNLRRIYFTFVAMDIFYRIPRSRRHIYIKTSKQWNALFLLIVCSRSRKPTAQNHNVVVYLL